MFFFFFNRWTTIDVAANHDAEPEENEMNIITYLKPYTQYAIFVETLTVELLQTGKRIGARSPILYERTSPAGKLIVYCIR
jgi:insulin receptor